MVGKIEIAVITDRSRKALVVDDFDQLRYGIVADLDELGGRALLSPWVEENVAQAYTQFKAIRAANQRRMRCWAALRIICAKKRNLLVGIVEKQECLNSTITIREALNLTYVPERRPAPIQWHSGVFPVP